VNTNRTLFYLHDGRAWVAELKDGRARVSSLVAWLSAHPGRGALRSLSLEPLAPSTATERSSWSRQARSGVASLIRRLRGARTLSDPNPGTAPR
jgi:hypothetical protein